MVEQEMIKLLNQIAENTKPKKSFQIIVSDKNTTLCTTFNPPINLETTKQYEIALTNLEAYYTFPNINKSNSVFRYSYDSGTNWVDINIPIGCYEITDINNTIQQEMKENGHFDETNDVYPITFSANGNTLHAVMEIQKGYQVDFTSKYSLCNVLGFHHKIYPVQVITSQKSL